MPGGCPDRRPPLPPASPEALPLANCAAIRMRSVLLSITVLRFCPACSPTAVAPCALACKAACANAAVCAIPLMSRNMLPFWTAVMMAAIPVGSGNAVGLWIVRTGAESWPGWIWSDCAREPDCTGAMSGAAIGMGESCQFQNRVRSVFSAAW